MNTKADKNLQQKMWTDKITGQGVGYRWFQSTQWVEYN